MVTLYIQHNSQVYQPSLIDGVEWKTEREGTPGQLTFKLIRDNTLKITEGDAIRLDIDNKKVFYGFVFTIKNSKDKQIDVTAYDQLRYLKNKDTYVYKNKTASDFIKMLANDYQLNLGNIVNTEYTIASRVEENEELFEMIKNALTLTLQNNGKMYVLYDNVGKLTLENIENKVVELLIDEETGQNFDYQTSIDSDVYNKVKLTYDNEKSGTREVYIAKSSENINQWGVLQYFDTLQESENGKTKADSLLSLYNKKKRKLSISKAIGSLEVRAGCLIPVKLNLGDTKILQLMIVEKCTHIFKENEHFMDLTLRGSDFDV